MKKSFYFLLLTMGLFLVACEKETLEEPNTTEDARPIEKINVNTDEEVFQAFDISVDSLNLLDQANSINKDFPILPQLPMQLINLDDLF